MLSFRFLTTDPRFDAAGLRIRGIGIGEVMPPSIIDRGGTGDYLFMLFHDDVEIDGHRKKAGTLALWPHNAPHRYGTRDRRWRHSWMHCDGPFIAQVFRRTPIAALRALRLFTQADPSSFDRDLLSVHEELAPETADPLVVCNLVENLIRRAIRPRTETSRPKVPAVFERARAHIDRHYDQKIGLSDLARSAGLSSRHFCTGFRKHFGVPPMAYLIRRRLHTAAALLRGTDDPVCEVARQVGYPDAFYFSKHFKSRFGVPPSSLRSE